MSSAEVFSLKMSFACALKCQGNQDRYESSLMLHTGISQLLSCSQLNSSRGEARQRVTQDLDNISLFWQLHNLHRPPNALGISLHTSVIRRRYGNTSRFWSPSAGLHPHGSGRWEIGRCLMSLWITWAVGNAYWEITSGSPTTEKRVWTWTLRLSVLNWELEHIRCLKARRKLC